MRLPIPPLAELDLFQPVKAPTDLLWRYLSTASGLACWQADEVKGSLHEGEFSLRWPFLGARLDLSVKEVSVGERIVLGAGQNVLELQLVPTGIRLSHRGLEENDDLEGLHCSWRVALCLLREAAEVYPGQTRTVTWSFAPVLLGRELLHYYFSDPEGLSRWLGRTTRVLEEEYPFQLELEERTLVGRVRVSQAGRDVALAVPDSNAFLVMRSLPGAGDSRVAAIGLSVFSEEAPPRGGSAPSLVAELALALERLKGLSSAPGLH